jgi:hypothetical protein
MEICSAVLRLTCRQMSDNNSQVVTYRQTDMMKLIGAFLQFFVADTPK